MASSKKTYDTDSIVLRRIFAVDPDTNGRISANTFLVTGPNGTGSFQDAVSFLSTISVPTSLVGGSGITLTNTNGVYTIATSSIGVSDLISTTIGLGQIYNSTILVAGTNITFSSNANQITINGQAGGGGGLAATDLTSTTKGLGSLGYLSSFATISTVNLSSGSLFSYFVSSQQIKASSITANKFIGDGSQLTGITGGGGLAATDLTSTTIGLGSLGYLSSFATISTVNLSSGSLFASFLSSQQIKASSITANKFIGDGSQLTGITGGGGLAATDLTSTTIGLGSLGYLSSFATISTVNLSSGSLFASLVSSQQITASSITANKFVGDGSLLTNVPGTGGIAIADLTSTTKGLGSMRYISSLSSVGTNLSSFSTSLSVSFNTLASVISSLTVSSLTFGSGDGYLNFPDMRAPSLSTMVIYTSSITATKFVGDGSQLTGINGGLAATDLTSTTIGLGSLGYLSSFATISTVNLSSGSLFSYFVSSQQITASSITANKFVGDGSLITNVPNTGVTSITAAGAGISVDRATGAVTITATGLTSGTVADVNLTSTIFGLAVFGYISTTSLVSSITALGTTGYLSSFNTISSINISSRSLFASFVSSQQMTASSITANKFVGDGSLLTNLPGGGGGLAATDLTSTTKGLGSLGYISTLSAFNSGTVYYLNWSQAGPTYPYKALQPIVTGEVQSSNPNSISPNTDLLIQTFQTSTVLPSFISAGIWDLNLFVKSDSYYTSVYYKLYKLHNGTPVQIGANSSSIGISPSDGTTIVQVVISIAVPYTPLSSGDTLYIEIHGVNSDISSSHNLTVYYEDSTYSHLHTTFLESVTELSTITGLGSLGYVSTASLVSSVIGLGTFGYLSSAAELISSPQLTSSLIGLASFGYLSSVTLRSTIQGLGTFGYLSSSAELISSPQLTSSLVGLGTFGYLSSAAELISSPQLTSSLMGLGSMMYLSSFDTLSSLNISSGSVYTSTTSTTEITAGRINFGTLYVNNIPIVFDQYGNLQMSFQAL